MTTAYTSLLGLALPVTGELSGTWGDTVNNSITSLLDSAIAGTTTLSSDADVTLSVTTGASNTSRQAILLCTGARTGVKTITAPQMTGPTVSKIYTVINNTTGGYSVIVVGAVGTGVTIVAGESALIAWNGSDFIKISNTSGAGVFTTLSVTGVATFSAGTAALPAITTTGDTNTGIWFPAADTIAFTEGGAESMRIDASGNLGVGITSLTQRFQVERSYDGSTWAKISNGNSTSGAAAGVLFGTDQGDAGAVSQNSSNAAYGTAANAVRLRNLLNAPITFETNATERMRLDSSGNLGIGTTSPTARLSVIAASANSTAATIGGIEYGGSKRGLTIKTFNSAGGDDCGVEFNAADGLAGYGAFKFAANTTTLATIDASGNLLVGTTTPVFNLAGRGLITINGSSAAALGFTAGAVDKGIILHTGTDMIMSNSVSGAITFQTNNNERARIDSSGTLLVSTTSNPLTSTCKFVVYGGTAEYNAAFYNSSATNPFGAVIRYSAAAPNGTGNQFLDCIDTGATRAQIRSDGGLANYSANNVNLSDRREKTNFAPAKSYLAVICAIPVQTFNYIDQNLEDDGGLTLGVVAQDVQAVAPELVMESNWASKDEEPKMRLSIYQTDLQYALMKALQELKAEFDAYKASHP